MKKFIIAIAAMISAVASVMAQDIATIPDLSVYTQDVSIKPGETATLSFHMKNSVNNVESLGLAFTLPDGISVATKANGRYQMAGNEDRFDGHVMSANYVEKKGIYKVAILQSGNPFVGNEGELFTFTIQASKDIKPGDYEVKLSEVELSGNSKIYNKGIISENGTYTGKITVATPTGINSVAGESAQGAVEIYNVNGVKQSTLQSGLNIVKNVKTGEVKTVSVK